MTAYRPTFPFPLLAGFAAVLASAGAGMAAEGACVADPAAVIATPEGTARRGRRPDSSAIAQSRSSSGASAR
nr:hypothetical protein [Mangrovicoccus ximenensis]